MEIPVFTVDAFTQEAFRGNPAAVCLLPRELNDELYQNIAAEMNLSDTAFITKRDSEDFSSGERFGLRWFSPKKEVALCGHATLASAAVLFYMQKNDNPVVVFETMSGELYVRQQGDSIVMDFPLNKPNTQDQHEIKGLLKVAVGDLPIHEVCYCPTTKKLMIRLTDTCKRAELTSLKPEAEDLLRNETTGKIISLIITLKAAENSTFDFYSRVFAPWVGVSEDPVTGSAHTVLAGYWSEKLKKQRMLGFQCSSRGGEVHLDMREDGRLDISGQAVIVLKGTLKI